MLKAHSLATRCFEQAKDNIKQAVDLYLAEKAGPKMTEVDAHSGVLGLSTTLYSEKVGGTKGGGVFGGKGDKEGCAGRFTREEDATLLRAIENALAKCVHLPLRCSDL